MRAVYRRLAEITSRRQRAVHWSRMPETKDQSTGSTRRRLSGADVMRAKVSAGTFAFDVVGP